MRQNLIQICLLAAVLPLPAVVQAQFDYTTNNGALTITGYAGPPWAVTIPTNINGLPVTGIGTFAFDGTSLTSITIPDSITSIGGAAFEDCPSLKIVLLGEGVTDIGNYTFDGCTSLTNVTIPSGVTNIGYFAFNGCSSLTSVTIPDSVTSIGEYAFAEDISLATTYIGSGVTNIGYGAFIDTGNPFFGTGGGIYFFFKGNAPVLAPDALGYYGMTIYYLPGATGWDSVGYPKILWNPQIQTHDGGFGVRNNQFGFNINWAGGSGQNVVVEACTNLTNPVWVVAGNVTFTNNSSYFSDPDWSNYPGRLYRLKNANPPPFIGIP